MTALAKFEAIEMRDELFAAAGWRSVVSGRMLCDGVPQLAHRVAKTKNHLREYGASVINHPLNLVPVCTLRENDFTNIGNQTLVKRELLNRIIRINQGLESMPSMSEYYAELREEYSQRWKP